MHWEFSQGAHGWGVDGIQRIEKVTSAVPLLW
jgi:hypothetical protein